MEVLKKLLFAMLLLSAFAITSCDDDDNDMNDPTGNSTTYDLSSVDVDGITGTAEFIENEDMSVTVNLDLDNTPDGGEHPAHIHMNTAAEGGNIAISLGMVDGDSGESSITFSTMDDGTSITYAELLNFDGYINVHRSSNELETIIAQGDIGQNTLTGEEIEYELMTRDVDGVSGTATFKERENGEALAILSLENTPVDGEHPAHIHMNTAAEGGDIAYTFTPVNGETGMSQSNVATFDDGSPFEYLDLLNYDGYVNVHLSANELGTIIAQGDIGENQLTGTSTTYDLMTVDVAGITGEAIFYERKNGEALAVLDIENTPMDGMHPSHIHANSASETGPIVFTFNIVNGETGISRTNVSTLDDQTQFGYDDVNSFDGYINVHLSADDLATIVAQGNIGSNVQ